MRAVQLIQCLILCLGGLAHGGWKDRLKPMHGDPSRSSERKAMETALRKAAAERGIDSAQASAEMAEAGWQFLSYDDRESALERFDKCWVLDPGNYECYWGYGVILYRSVRSDEALRYLDIARKLNGGSVSLNMDIAAVHLQRFQQNGAKDRVAAFKADSILDAQRGIDSTDRKYLCHGSEMKEILGKWAEAEELARRCSGAGFSETVFRSYLPGDTSVPALAFHLGASVGFPTLTHFDFGVYLYDAVHFKINASMFTYPDRYRSNLYVGSVKHGTDEVGVGILVPLSERMRLIPGIYLARNYIDYIGAKIGIEGFVANPVFDHSPARLFYIGFKSFLVNY